MKNNIREIKATPNYSKRTFTLRTDGNKYRTIQLSKEEFDNCLYNTNSDWLYFLRGADYYVVR